MSRQYCVVAWRWAKDGSIENAYMEEVVGPFPSRSLAVQWATLRKKRPNRHANVLVLTPCCEDCIEGATALLPASLCSMRETTAIASAAAPSTPGRRKPV